MDRPAWQGWRTAAVVVGVLLVTLSIGLVVTIQMVRPDQADGDAPADEPRGVAGTFGSTVAASGSPTPPPPPSATATAVPSPPPVSYPASADEYATALLNAWLAGDTGRVGELATPAAITLMGQAPGSLPGGWEFFDCWLRAVQPVPATAQRSRRHVRCAGRSRAPGPAQGGHPRLCRLNPI